VTSFADLQAEHRALLDGLPKGRPTDEYVGSVLAFIARATAEAANIPASRDRDQLRANLRFWASYVFDQTGAYPDTTLRPSLLADSGPGAAPPPVPPRPWSRVLLAAIGGSLCLATALCAGLVLSQGPAWGLFGPTATALDRPTVRPPSATPDQSLTPGAIVPTLATTPGSTPDETPITVPASATPTPTRVGGASTPGPTELPSRRTLMLADVSQGPGPDCAFRTVQVSLDAAGRLSPDQVRGALAELRLPGSQEPDAIAEVGPNGASLEIFAPNQEGEPVLLSVAHPGLTFSSVVLQFQPGCAGNLAQVRYVAAEAPSALPAQPPAVAGLELGWTLITWGPAPQDDGTWIAQLELFANGGDGHYIFWDGAGLSTGQPEILLSQRACAAAHRTVGVSSGGVSLLRELILQAPYCPHAP
jgi:hypothetical protein